MLRYLAAVLLFCASPGQALADSIQIVLSPEYSSVTRFNTADAPTTSSHTDQHAETSNSNPDVGFYHIEEDATHDISRGAVTAHIAIQASPNTSGHVIPQGSVSSSLIYYMELVGPGSDPVAVNVIAPLTITGDSIYEGGGASWSLTRSGDPIVIAGDSISCNFETENLCNDTYYTHIIGSTQVDLVPNIIYAMHTVASVAGNAAFAQIGFVSEGQAITAIADPYISIVPGQQNADLYSLSFSDGFLNLPLDSVTVPEPPTWAIMLAGLGMMGFAMRRKSQAECKSVA